ncbi:MAG: PHP domain-containing protein, partial [Ruminococcus bromii]
MKICDIHTHSSNSFDAENTVEEMCNSACNKGLFALAITDHCEAPEILLGSESEYGDFSKLIPKSNYETSIMQDRYKGKINILRGIELGEPMHNAECTKKALCFGDFDIIIASVHNLRNRPDFYYMDFKKEDVKAILNMYFDE